jgi:hypothetical protein
MQRGDTVKFVIDFLKIISIIEEEGLVVAKPLELTTDATRNSVTMHTRFKFPLDYIKELGCNEVEDLLDLTTNRYFVSYVEGTDVLLQDEYNNHYIKAKAFQLVY